MMASFAATAMRCACIDIGSNTTRLLVASVEVDGLVPLDSQKVRLSLGEEIERHGAVSRVHVAAVAIRQLSPTQSVLAGGLPVPTDGDASRERHGRPWMWAPDGAGLARQLRETGLL